MIDVLAIISQIKTPGFFITADIIVASECIPDHLNAFISEKLNAIENGVGARKFIFSENGWRIYLTFFPTDRTVEPKYALMNKVVKSKGKLII